MTQTSDKPAPRPRRRRVPAVPSTEAGAAALAWRKHNIGRLLNNAINRFESRILQLMDTAGHGAFSLSHVAITRNLDIEGTRATDLAKRAGITKQSVGELIVQLEAGGIVARRPDPGDRRSRIIFFTPLGLEWLAAFHTALRQAETEMETELGRARVQDLKQALKKYGGS